MCWLCKKVQVTNLAGAFSTLGHRCEANTACRASLSCKYRLWVFVMPITKAETRRLEHTATKCWQYAIPCLQHEVSRGQSGKINLTGKGWEFRVRHYTYQHCCHFQQTLLLTNLVHLSWCMYWSVYQLFIYIFLQLLTYISIQPKHFHQNQLLTNNTGLPTRKLSTQWPKKPQITSSIITYITVVFEGQKIWKVTHVIPPSTKWCTFFKITAVHELTKLFTTGR